jgi:hypothetical protein
MDTLDTIRAIIAKLAAAMVRRPPSDFVCGDCERWKRCGMVPNKDCIVMAAQIARDGGLPPRHGGLPAC